MNHWPFIAAAYALTIVASGGLAFSAFLSMRRAERAAEDLRRR
ncbi:heme exporter protein CcmD [Sphingomonas sp.]|nr:heme exporter protein CcmD [Sphingomonas sp.]